MWTAQEWSLFTFSASLTFNALTLWTADSEINVSTFSKLPLNFKSPPQPVISTHALYRLHFTPHEDTGLYCNVPFKPQKPMFSQVCTVTLKLWHHDCCPLFYWAMNAGWNVLFFRTWMSLPCLAAFCSATMEDGCEAAGCARTITQHSLNTFLPSLCSSWIFDAHEVLVQNVCLLQQLASYSSTIICRMILYQIY